MDNIFKHIKESDIVYISGPMSGYPMLNRCAFKNVEYMLRKHSGCCVLSPVFIQDAYPDMGYDKKMEIDLAFVRISTVIVNIPGWMNSPGALDERAEALRHGIRIYELKELRNC